jgi:hypothetical protein
MSLPMASDTGRLRLWGRFSPLGFVIGVLTLIIDQAHKWWMLNI